MKRIARVFLAAGITAALLIPVGVAAASPADGGKSAAARNHDGGNARQQHRVGLDRAGRVGVDVEVVARGPLDTVLGSYQWSGDLFDTGIITVVSYTLGLDANGVPAIADFAVDDSTLPDGVTYETRGPVNGTRDRSGEHRIDSTTTTVPDTGSTVADTSSTSAAAGVEETTTTVTDESTTTEVTPSRPTITTFYAKAAVRFAMGGEHRGLMVLASGKLGDQPMAMLRTVYVAMHDKQRPEDTTSTTTAEDTSSTTAAESSSTSTDVTAGQAAAQTGDLKGTGLTWEQSKDRPDRWKTSDTERRDRARHEQQRRAQQRVSAGS
jgi:hypothetical protein